MLLKAQLYQTERQLLLLQDGMARKTASLWEAENILKVRKRWREVYTTMSINVVIVIIIIIIIIIIFQINKIIMVIIIAIIPPRT